MSVNPSVAQLRQAADQHLNAARDALGENKGGTPGSAAYLGHVSTECALKLRMLRQYKKSRTDEMEQVLGEELFKKLFRSADGHNLDLLANHSALRRLLETEGKRGLLQGRPWARMKDAERPYALRYGTERLARNDVKDELEIAREIVNLVTRP